MKFLVDETPLYKFDCPFCNQYHSKSGYYCKFDDDECDLDDESCECRWLKEVTMETSKIGPAIMNILDHPYEIKPYKSPTEETMQIVRSMAEPPRTVVPTMPIKMDSDCNKLCKSVNRLSCDYCKSNYIVSDFFYIAKRANSDEYVVGYLIKSKDGVIQGILNSFTNYKELAFVDESTLEEMR